MLNFYIDADKFSVDYFGHAVQNYSKYLTDNDYIREVEPTQFRWTNGQPKFQVMNDFYQMLLMGGEI